MTLFTIGYQSTAQPDMIATLKDAGVDIVVDVRAVAASRRAGFSKTILRASLEAEGIEYVHLRSLGTPKAGREAARKGRIAEMETIFAAHLETPAAQEGLAQATAIARARAAALLCFEACAEGCHRRIVAARIQGATGCAVRNL
jgi:uncharacterized protein (DUF488 family)